MVGWLNYLRTRATRGLLGTGNLAQWSSDEAVTSVGTQRYLIATSEAEDIGTTDLTSPFVPVNSEYFCWILAAFSVYRKAVWTTGVEPALTVRPNSICPMLYQRGTLPP